MAMDVLRINTLFTLTSPGNQIIIIIIISFMERQLVTFMSHSWVMHAIIVHMIITRKIDIISVRIVYDITKVCFVYFLVRKTNGNPIYQITHHLDIIGKSKHEGLQLHL